MPRATRAPVVLTTLLLAACGGSGQASEPAAAPPATVTATTGATTVGVPEGDPAAAVTCTRADFPSQGASHVEELPEGFEYNSFPATSGPHSVPVIWNAYAEPLPAINLVHNLEHGGIVVQFGSEVPEADVEAAAEWYIADPVALVLAPLPELGDTIAATAWTHLLACDGFDVEAFTAFRDEFRFNGPEAIPPANLQPGM